MVIIILKPLSTSTHVQLRACYFCPEQVNCLFPNCFLSEKCKKSCGNCKGGSHVGDFSGGGRPSNHGNHHNGDVSHGSVYPWGRR